MDIPLEEDDSSDEEYQPEEEDEDETAEEVTVAEHIPTLISFYVRQWGALKCSLYFGKNLISKV